MDNETTKETLDLIEELREKESIINNGRGIPCVNSILIYLDNHDFGSARAIFVNDGDKIAQYPEIESILEKILGISGRYK